MAVRRAIPSEVAKIVRALERKPPNGNDSSGAVRRFQMEINAARTFGHGDIPSSVLQDAYGLFGIDTIWPRAGEHRDGPRVGCWLKCNPVRVRADLLTGGILDATGAHGRPGMYLDSCYRDQGCHGQ